MLGFKVVLPDLRGGIERSRLSAVGSALRSLGLPGAASLAAFVTSTVEGDAACSHALRLLLHPLVANGLERGSSTAA